MTDIPFEVQSLPARLGATARMDGDEIIVGLQPHPAVLRLGVVRTSVISYLVDCVAGIPLQREGGWTLTTDMTVRCEPVPAPSEITATFRPLRQGRRTSTARVRITDDTGRVIGDGAIGFASVAHRDGDPPLPALTNQEIVDRFAGLPLITEPLREAAGIHVLDAAAGTVEVDVTPSLRNPAGTLQGAMTALIAEVAAEELLSARSDTPVVITDLDIRYLDRTSAGPVRSRAEVVGAGPGAAVVVELVDASTDAVVALVHARGEPVERTGD